MPKKWKYTLLHKILAQDLQKKLTNGILLAGFIKQLKWSVGHNWEYLAFFYPHQEMRYFYNKSYDRSTRQSDIHR